MSTSSERRPNLMGEGEMVRGACDLHIGSSLMERDRQNVPTKIQNSGLISE